VSLNSVDSASDQKTSKFFVSCGRIHGRTHGCKWSLLEVREGNTKGSMVGLRWKLEAGEVCFCSLGVWVFGVFFVFSFLVLRSNPGPHTC
jgi:hypothetical protein